MTRLVLFLAAAGLWAQHPMNPDAEVRLRRMTEARDHIETAARLAWRTANAPEEQIVVQAIHGFYTHEFQPPISADPEIATLTDKGADVLVARWIVGAGSPFSELIAWDTPENTSYIFKLPARTWWTAAGVQSFFDRLLWPTPSDTWMSRPYSFDLNIVRDPITHELSGSGGLIEKEPPRQFDVGAMNWVSIWETNSASYISIGFHQLKVQPYPEAMRNVPERFPPLKTRVGAWSKERILRELAPGGSVDRDRVLARELVMRDMTEAELDYLLNSRWVNENGELLSAVAKANQLTRFSEVVGKYLLRDDWGFDVYSVQQHPFQEILQSFETNFTQVAILVLGNSPDADAAFAYAVRHGSTAEDYHAIERITQSRPGRASGLREMAKRLGIEQQ